MKYSIIICPNDENSNAIEHACHFVKALILDSTSKNTHDIHVFFYGLAVNRAFDNQNKWQDLAQQGVSLIACSTIAESFLSKQQSTLPYFSLAGLGQWMEATLTADKNIEFI